MDKRVMVAMSGGVDSSVAALILLEQGYDVTGVTLKLFDAEEQCDVLQTKTCCSLSDVEDARSVCDRLGLSHFVFNFKDRFENHVIKRFVQSYCRGNTPNPCIDCNRYIKFGEMLDRAITLDHQYLATGHYAKIQYDAASGRYLLCKAKDLTKDQTYMLYAMKQSELAKTLFPLGDLEKSKVREIAKEYGFENAKKPDSQDICFVRNGDYAGFIQDYTGERMPEGDYLDIKGYVIGKHKGIHHYTIGQRKGLGITFGQPQFVVAKDFQNNTVTLGGTDALFSNRLVAEDVNMIAVEQVTAPMKVKVKTRYSQKEEDATLHPMENGSILIEFVAPQRAITPGQAAVFYDDDIVVGGGTIVS